MAPYIITAVIIIVVGSVIAYYMARFMKGRLRIDLAGNNRFQSGDKINGKLTLEAKRNIEGALIISLVGYEQVRRRSGSDNQTSKSWEERFRQDQVLEEDRTFASGFTEQYDISLAVPTADQARGGGMLDAVLDSDQIPGAIKSIAKMASAFSGRGRMKWKVEARLDAKGVDLFTTQTIKIHLA